MRSFVVIAFLIWAISVQAHPSYGLVITPDGDIVFCDVLHNDGTLWKLDRDGRLVELLTGEHCHFIYQDRDGNIWGTNHEYLPTIQGNRNTLWKFTPEGKKITIIQPTIKTSEFSGVNFVVDSSGHIYYDFENQIYVRQGDGTTRLYAQPSFGRIMSLQMDHCGDLYVVSNNTHGGSIYKITPDGSAELEAMNLKEQKPRNPPFPKDMHNMLYASYIDSCSTIYVANSGSRRISAITQDRKVSHIYHSKKPWYPVAYTEREGRAFVMEMGMSLFRGGNIGPRIVEVTDGIRKVLIEVK